MISETTKKPEAKPKNPDSAAIAAVERSLDKLGLDRDVGGTVNVLAKCLIELAGLHGEKVQQRIAAALGMPDLAPPVRTSIKGGGKPRPAKSEPKPTQKKGTRKK